MTQQTQTKRRSGRRAYLTGTACGLVSVLAGCTTSGDDDPSTGDPSNGETDTFPTIEWEGNTLTVTIASDADVGYVDLVDPNGETVKRDFPKDTAEVSYTLLGEIADGYEPGEYQLVAANGESVIDETTISLEPELTITAVKRAADHPDMDWDKDSSRWENQAALEIENAGTAPSYLKSVRWVDSPLALIGHREETESYHNTLLPAGETTTIYGMASYATYALGYGSLNCEEYDTVDLTATAIVQAGENPSYAQTVDYGGSQNNCELSIVDGGPVESSTGGD
ncbi:hypothetical protein [Halovivax limisalsi]|uniref:hypothetical protein n=1 Tax=Halovivax limisalsi TaxID=1453760 RepID=UPI001FFDC1FC|nr:hypothetical protein [Halovivax limisalsi]